MYPKATTASREGYCAAYDRPNVQEESKIWNQVLQSNISKMIMLYGITFGVIYKKVGPFFPT
jgi:hypothetical protein